MHVCVCVCVVGEKGRDRGMDVVLPVGPQHERQSALPAGILGQASARSARTGKHHVQEVLGVVEVVAGVDDGLADRGLVGHRRQRGHLGDEAVARAQLLRRVPAAAGAAERVGHVGDEQSSATKSSIVAAAGSSRAGLS